MKFSNSSFFVDCTFSEISVDISESSPTFFLFLPTKGTILLGFGALKEYVELELGARFSRLGCWWCFCFVSSLLVSFLEKEGL